MMRKFQTLAALTGLVVAAACGTKEAPGPLEPTGPTGRIRFVNLITDTTRGRVNAILEGVPFGVNLTYTQSTPATLPSPSTAIYSAILTGPRTLVLKRTADTSVVVATVSFTVAAGQDQTVYAVGGAAASAVTSLVVNDSNPVVASTQARLRAVNLSPTAGAVDIFVTAPNADLAAATPTFANVAYRGASAYASLAPGTYQVRAAPAGTAPTARAAAVSVNLASLALSGGAGSTIVVADRNIGGAPLIAFTLADR
ncbi:MAG: hypothetical protein JWM41_326 [Gemmatimonadetes bacterium]|nr:hypothetical protein [Gemmatimonadota bacterium]